MQWDFTVGDPRVVRGRPTEQKTEQNNIFRNDVKREQTVVMRVLRVSQVVTTHMDTLKLPRTLQSHKVKLRPHTTVPRACGCSSGGTQERNNGCSCVSGDLFALAARLGDVPAAAAAAAAGILTLDCRFDALMLDLDVFRVVNILFFFFFRQLRLLLFLDLDLGGNRRGLLHLVLVRGSRASCFPDQVHDVVRLLVEEDALEGALLCVGGAVEQLGADHDGAPRTVVHDLGLKGRAVFDVDNLDRGDASC